MVRALRIEYEHAFYHVMNRGKGQQDIFCGDGYFQAFLDTVVEASERFNAIIHCYCLMNNHYHLLIETPIANLGRVMRHINGVYTQRYNRMKKTDGPLFRGRYKAILVDPDSYLLQLSSYIHRNPIECRKPLVVKLEDWPWSSYPAYIGKVCAPNWLTLSEIEGAGGFNRKNNTYATFVEVNNDDELTAYYRKKNIPAILGDKYFKESALQRAQLSLQDGPPAIYSKPSADLIVQQIGLIFDMTFDEKSAKGCLYSGF